MVEGRSVSRILMCINEIKKTEFGIELPWWSSIIQAMSTGDGTIRMSIL